MLTELTIKDFAIIDELLLKFSPGFNVLTGETGAGKSIIIDAVSLLLGGRSESTLVRADSEAAQIEGVFLLSASLQKEILPILEREGLEGEGDDTLLMGREIRTGGRSFCRVNGRTVSLALMKEIADPLVDIHGQSEHLSLLRVRQHGVFLDRYGGLEELREEVARKVRLLRETRRELDELLRDEREIARRIDRLTFQLQEIEAANLRPGEEEELSAERVRLSNAERLAQLASEAYGALYEGSEDIPSAFDLLGQTIRTLEQICRIDESLKERVEQAEAVSYQMEDLAGMLGDYRDEMEFNPARLQQVEERLALIHTLKRKYGDSIEEILAFAEGAGRELDNISRSEERVEELREIEERLRREAGEVAARLSARRGEVGRALGEGVEAQLNDLGMKGTQFVAQIGHTPDENGVYVGGESLRCDERGIDEVEFLISPNPGEPLKPLAKIASGGETSRLMLALKTVLSLADETPTLIFDEIDQGIGGRIGDVVGSKLWQLSGIPGKEHQVLCITHLPQIAGYAERHFHVSKELSRGRTVTGVRELRDVERVDELARMLGTPSQGTRRSAMEILERAAAVRAANRE